VSSNCRSLVFRARKVRALALVTGLGGRDTVRLV